MTNQVDPSNPSNPKPSRRALLRAAVSAAAVAAVTPLARGQQPTTAPATRPTRRYYYVDGYHGGVDGHMPAESLRNVLDGLDKFPNWKVTFEIEPYSWAAFAKTDPASVERLRKFLADATPAGRVEIVSGAYGQPYAWNASGESNIRQLMYGRAELKAVFPDLVVDTYAVQEPCWTSCLPQLLKSFGYRRAVMKNSTCWGGYHAPMVDADLVNWVGPDGTGIVGVPRYLTEQLIGPATMDGAQPTAAFIDRCRAAGIAHPVGAMLQDMGWPGRPWRLGIAEDVFKAMTHTTWREYVEAIAERPTKEWKATQEDLRVGLPWGASVLQRIAQQTRAGENAVARAEKLAAMAAIRRGHDYPAEVLDEVWRNVLWMQHHDVWIVPYNKHRGGTWTSAAEAKHGAVERACAKVVADAASATAPAAEGVGMRFVRVYNTTGFRRRGDLAAVEVPADRTYRVLDGDGASHRCQTVRDGRSPEKATLLFPAVVPATGYATYRVEDRPPAPRGAPGPRASAWTEPDGTVVLQTASQKVTIDPAKGGRIRSLYSADAEREFIDPASPRGFNEYRGYFPAEDRWLSSADAPAEVRVVEDGPLRATARVIGRIGGWAFTTEIALTDGHRWIDVRTTFDFPADPPRRQQPAAGPAAARFRVGQAWEKGKDATRSNRKPYYDSSFKLQALFPTTLENPTLHKNAPFDVCRAGGDTRFEAWDAVRNNVVLNWVDLVEPGDDGDGLAIMSDHATAYAWAPGEPLGLVACYAGPGTWFDYGLGHAPSISYAIVPHAGDWVKARLWRELARWSEPLVARVCAEPAKDDVEWSLVDATDGGLEVAAVHRSAADRFDVRLFNADGDDKPQRVRLAKEVRRTEWVELDGRVVAEAPIERGPGGEGFVTVAMPRFGVRTLRCAT